MVASSQTLIGIGVPPLQAKAIGNTVATIAGVGVLQTGAAALVNNVNLLTTSGGATAFLLSTVWNVGDEVIVFNTSSTTALVYPQSGGAIDGGSADTSVSITQNEGRTFIKTSATTWRSGESVLVASSLNVSGNTTTGTLNVTSTATISGAITVGGAANLSSTVSVAGNTFIGATTSNVIGGWGAAGTAQRASAVQASITVGIATATGFGFSSSTAAENIVAELNEIRATLVALGAWKGSA